MNESRCYKKFLLSEFFMSKKLLSSKASISSEVVNSIFSFLTRLDTVPLIISIAVLCQFQLYRKQKSGDVSTFPRASTILLLNSSSLTSNTKQNQSNKLLSEPSPGQKTSTSEDTHHDSWADKKGEKVIHLPSSSHFSKSFCLKWTGHIK